MQKKVNWARLLFAALTLAVMVFIFCNSSQTAPESSATSAPLVEQVATLVIPQFKQLPPVEQEYHLSQLTSVVREGAHLAEFAALSLFAGLFALTFRKPFLRSAAAVFVFCVLYALSDELHQLCVPGRTFQLLDLAMDSIGSLLGVLAALVLGFLWRRRKTNTKDKESRKS